MRRLLLALNASSDRGLEAEAAVKDLLALGMAVSVDMTAQLLGAVARSLLVQTLLTAQLPLRR